MSTVKLPHKYSQLTAAGGGRFLIFHFADQNKAGIFDIMTGKVEVQIDGVGAGDLLAGSAAKLIVVSPGKMMIRRWDLRSGKRDGITLLKSSDTPREAFMGCGGNGPLLLVGDSGSQLIDLDSLKPIRIDGPDFGGRGRYGRSVHVSADGKTFGTIPTGYGPVAFSIFHIEGNRTTAVPFASTSNAIRWAQPTASGYLVMRPGGDLVNRNGRPIAAEWLKGAALVPATESGYFIVVRVDHRDRNDKRKTRMTFYSTADCHPILTETGFEELIPKSISSWHEIAGALRLGHEWRVQFVPSLNRLVTIPREKQGRQLVMIRDVHLTEMLKTREVPYLFVESIPPLTVAPGGSLDYQIDVQSSAKNVKLTLEDGPEGATLKKGRVKWQAPASYLDDWARFLISIRNSGGDEIFHSFEVAVKLRD